MAERNLQTGWFALHPNAGARLAYSELTVRVGHSARAEIFWESPESDSGVYNGIDLEYMRSRATISMFMCLDPYASWSREGTSKLPVDVRARMRELVDGAETDLNELFSTLVAQDPELVATIEVDDLEDGVPPGGTTPESNNLWRAAHDVTVPSVKPWWATNDERSDDERP